MYIFSFNRFAGFDRVFKLKISDDVAGGYQKVFIKGNLVAYQDDFFLCLGDETSFQEQYEYKYQINEPEISLISKSFLSDKTLDMINWMVYRRYSNYKSVLKYFVSFDIDNLVKRGKIQEARLNKKRIVNKELSFENGVFEFTENNIGGQQLVIFPDLWTIFNTLDEELLSSKGNVLLSSNDSQNKKDKNRLMIKNGEIKNAFCTHGEIFQDWNNLKKIILIDPYKRYYENQQDPRYNVKTVVEKMSEIYGAELMITQ